jgi:hypothetical protein
VSAADLLAGVTHLPDLARDAILTIAVARSALWLWLTAQRSITAVAMERALRRQLRP